MFRRGELALAHLAAILLRRLDHGPADVGVLLDETRSQVVEEAEQVVRHQDLTVAAGAGADADGRDLHRLRDLLGQLARHAFQHDRESTGLLDGQGVFHQATPLTLAETASVFGETVTFGRLLSATTEPAERLALLAENLEGQIATVFRQVAMNRFEDAVHRARRDQGELSVDDFNAHWVASQSAMLGDSVELTEGYRTWWSYIPHCIGTPGYV